MKRTTLSKFVGAGVLSMSLAMGTLAMPSYAQTGTGTGTGTGTDTTPGTNPVVVDTNREGDRDFDWGWLGLLGLLGLAGLAKKSHSEPTRYREPGEVGTGTGTRY
ncbi:MAG: WGxxGxxG family protein [Crinalium sp.]